MIECKDVKDLDFNDLCNLVNYAAGFWEAVVDLQLEATEESYVWVRNRLRHICEILEK